MRGIASSDSPVARFACRACDQLRVIAGRHPRDDRAALAEPADLLGRRLVHLRDDVALPDGIRRSDAGTRLPIGVVGELRISAGARFDLDLVAERQQLADGLRRGGHQRLSVPAFLGYPDTHRPSQSFHRSVCVLSIDHSVCVVRDERADALRGCRMRGPEGSVAGTYRESRRVGGPHAWCQPVGAFGVPSEGRSGARRTGRRPRRGDPARASPRGRRPGILRRRQALADPLPKLQGADPQQTHELTRARS